MKDAHGKVIAKESSLGKDVIVAMVMANEKASISWFSKWLASRFKGTNYSLDYLLMKALAIALALLSIAKISSSS